MEQAFLEHLAEKIKTNHAGLGSRLCVVMPNRRAGLFLKRYLVPKTQAPVWAPMVFSVEDFISHISSLTVPDPLTLMFGLYEAHCSVEKEKATGFDDFTGWSRGLMRDFEEIDQYLVNPSDLFGFLSETKAMSLWNMDGKPLTEFEKQYLKFFNALPAYYNFFAEKLLKSGQAYHGLACRQVAENPDKFLKPLPWDYIIFAGFNAITPAQLTIIRHLIGEEKAEIFWDADSYYIENTDQEAGRFLRTYLKDKSLGKPGEVSRYFENGQKTIQMAGVPRNIGQARMAGNILKGIIDNNDPNILSRTAVVLADESLLLPLLNAIPEEAGQFNITMGYPMQQAPLYGFFDHLINMHINASEGKDPLLAYFYNKDVISLLQHPYTALIADSKLLRLSLENIRKAKNAFIMADAFLTDSDKDLVGYTALKSLFIKLKSPAELTALIINAIDLFKNADELKGAEGKDYQGADGEILFSLALIANRLHTLVNESGLIGELRTLQNLFREAAAAMPVPFYGEPLEGVQVMGMLETRTLDFENVILLSANEDTLPSKKTYNSFIPFEIRQQFGMPTHHDQQAVFAYHFYRLLQRCQNAWLIYNSEADELGGGEKSRFLSQLFTEMPSVNPDISLKEIKPSAKAIITEALPISVDKTSEINDKLIQLAKKGFSPTSLNTYLACKLNFYFTNILGLGEPEEADETIDYRTLGIVIHHVLQIFYTPFIGGFPLKSDFDKMREQAGDAIMEALKKEFPGGDVSSGRNLLIVKVANVWISRFLQSESEESGTSGNSLIIGLEDQLRANLMIELQDGTALEILLKGFADRIEQVGGITRIIDYKTGKVSATDLKPKTVESLFEASSKPKDKAFQLLFYLLLASNDQNIKHLSANAEAGIITFRSLKDGFLPLVLPGNDNNSVLQEFESRIKTLLEEIYNSEIPFTQTTIKEHCILCPFKSICHKTEEKKAW